jgi:ATP-dependent Clp protease ATP-binding subunit ClpA
LRRPHGGSNLPLVRAATRRPGLQFIGLVTPWEFQDILSLDASVVDVWSHIELGAPDKPTALQMARMERDKLQKEYRLVIPDHVLERTMSLSSDILISTAHPAKVVGVLRQACEDADFDRTCLQTETSTLSTNDIIRVLAEASGIPERTIAGSGDRIEFRHILSTEVVGQEAAVESVSAELELIKAGLNEPGKPASVLLFAGTTGVGKTELAKRIADLYSPSKSLHTYSMGNLTEPHSVSSIIGVPPGYVGHDLGGPLINELNADPYSVFLLDEADKAHPNIWKPFLHLFDEGWIGDQRGVRAFADRAIFILTTNVGDQHIAQMSAAGRSVAEIATRVKELLGRTKQERSGQPVFSPQFVARLRHVVVFQPLSSDAMVAIARGKCESMSRQWQRKREKKLSVATELCDGIGSRAHELNQAAGGKEGGRIVRRLLTDLIELPIQRDALDRADEYALCTEIQVELDRDSPELRATIKFQPRRG